MAIAELFEIQQLIDKCDQLYYRTGTSPLSDSEYELVKKKLRKLNPTDERLTRVGPPYTDEEIDKETKHSIPMGSVDNTKDYLLGFKPWLKTVASETTPVRASFKMDGSSIAVYYENGKLTKAITRGNGTVGHDITANATAWMHLPLQIPTTTSVTVRGEAMLHKSDFAKIAAEDGLDSNPRNVGAGIVGRHDGRNSNYIRFYAFNVYSDEIGESPNEGDKLAYLEKLGFMIVSNQLCDSPEAFESFYNHTYVAREQLDFEIDGVVVVIEDGKIQHSHITDAASRLRPKFARAVKFPMFEAETICTGCTITIGHNGVLNPTAEYEPVRVGGVVSSNANLNNWNPNSSAPSAYHVGIGDKIRIGLAGDIIPKLTKIVKPVFMVPTDGFIGTLEQIAARYGEINYEEEENPLPGTEHCTGF